MSASQKVQLYLARMTSSEGSICQWGDREPWIAGWQNFSNSFFGQVMQFQRACHAIMYHVRAYSEYNYCYLYLVLYSSISRERWQCLSFLNGS